MVVLLLGLERSFQTSISLFCWWFQKGVPEEAITRLARVGYDNSLGYLEGGMSAWIQAGKTTEQITSITAKEFEQRFNTKSIAVLDVRKDGEYNQRTFRRGSYRAPFFG